MAHFTLPLHRVQWNVTEQKASHDGSNDKKTDSQSDVTMSVGVECHRRWINEHDVGVVTKQY